MAPRAGDRGLVVGLGAAHDAGTGAAHQALAPHRGEETIICHRGKIVFDLSGAECETLEVEDLSDDSLLLGQRAMTLSRRSRIRAAWFGDERDE